MIVHGSHGGGGCYLTPEELMDQYSGKNAPLPNSRVKGHAWDWADAIRNGRKAGSDFSYGGPLTQLACSASSPSVSRPGPAMGRQKSPLHQ